jgi:CspA family cold shock protein
MIEVTANLIGARRLAVRASRSRGSLISGTPLSTVAMAKGTVDFFNDTGGYGFIDTEDADEDVFFHMEDVGGPDLEEGQEIEFDIEQADKGPRATNVQRL